MAGECFRKVKCLTPLQGKRSLLAHTPSTRNPRWNNLFFSKMKAIAQVPHSLRSIFLSPLTNCPSLLYPPSSLRAGRQPCHWQLTSMSELAARLAAVNSSLNSLYASSESAVPPSSHHGTSKWLHIIGFRGVQSYASGSLYQSSLSNRGVACWLAGMG